MLADLNSLLTPFSLSLNGEQLAQFEKYLALLLDWNERINLTAIRNEDEIVVRHFLDSLSLATVTGNLNGQRVVDVGTGAGFPGFPLKILYPKLRLTLVDSVAKKGRFLQAMVDELALKRVYILSERAEVLGQDVAHRERYDWAVARGVARMPALAEYLLPLCKVGGHLLVQKGETADVEIADAKRAIQLLGGGLPKINEIKLPGVDTRHFLVRVPKEKLTPKKYPRRVGMPAKNPL